MYRLLLSLTVIGVLPSLTGCLAFARRQVDHRLSPEAVSQITQNSTKADVTRLLGAPQEIVFSNREHDPLREHAYIYDHSTTKFSVISLALVNFGNSDEKSDRVVVFFDEAGKVTHVGATFRAEDASYGFPFGK